MHFVRASFAAFFGVLLDASLARKTVMPWMCLERCDFDASQIQSQLQQIRDNLDVVNAVSFEIFNLGPNGTLVRNNLTDVHQDLIDMGVETYAMVSSFPYPEDFILWMRYIFNDGDGFIQETIDQALSLGFTGYNCDFEPIGNITQQDAADYAVFLTKWHDALAAARRPIKLSVDTATWSPMWNITLLGESSVDRVISMATYTGKDSTFETKLGFYTSNVSKEKLGIGLQTDNRNYTADEIQWRFNLIKEHGVQEVDLWQMPIPDTWFPALRDFVNEDHEDNSSLIGVLSGCSVAVVGVAGYFYYRRRMSAKKSVFSSPSSHDGYVAVPVNY